MGATIKFTSSDEGTNRRLERGGVVNNTNKRGKKAMQGKKKTVIRERNGKTTEKWVGFSITLFVKPWMICRHSSCSLPGGVQLYKTSFHNHGDRWRLWIRPVILRTKKNKNKPLFCIYESDEWTKTWKLCNTCMTRKIYPWAEKCKFISILENVSPQHRIDVRRIWIFLSIWWRVHRCNWRKKYITKTKFIITA